MTMSWCAAPWCACSRARDSPPSRRATGVPPRGCSRRLPGWGGWAPIAGFPRLAGCPRRCPDIAVLMLTGVSELTTAVECLTHGAMDYLAKPVLADDLRARGNHALEKRRLVLENRFLQQSYQERLEASIRELDQRNKEQFVGQIQMAVRMLEKKDVYNRGDSQRGSPHEGK